MTKKFILYSTPFMLLFALITILEPWLYLHLLTSSEIEDIKKTDFEIIAHKGAAGLAPENTLAAFQKALELGVDMIELDVRQTHDEEIVVFHDQMLDRTTNGKGDIHDYTLAQLQELDAGSWFDPKFSDQTVPTLKEALDLISAYNEEHREERCKVLIEIKHMDHPHYHDFADKLVDIVASENDGFEWVILQSYEDKYLEEAHAYDERIQTKKMLIGEDSAPLIAFYAETRVHLGRSEQEGNLMALNPEYTTLSPRRVFRMHARGYKVYTYAVNTEEEMIKMLNMGVDGIITDHPEILVKIKEQVQKNNL